MKEHEVSTIADMVKIVNEENVDRFLADLKSLMLEAKDVPGEVSAMNWTDDGTVGCTERNLNDRKFKFLDQLSFEAIPAIESCADAFVRIVDLVGERNAFMTITGPDGYHRVVLGGKDITYGLVDVATERARQIHIEGFDAENDALYTNNELVDAAITYATPDEMRMKFPGGVPMTWPWDPEWFKPGDGSKEGRLRELTKAGALIVAEIDRLNNES